VPAYRVLVGLDYPPDRRAEAGDVVEDLPGKSIKWLTEQELIEPADKTKPAPKAAPTPEPTPEGDED
jgi:hypothetical protein